MVPKDFQLGLEKGRVQNKAQFRVRTTKSALLRANDQNSGTI